MNIRVTTSHCRFGLEFYGFFSSHATDCEFKVKTQADTEITRVLFTNLFTNLSPIFLLIQIQIMRLLIGSLVGLLVGKSYHTKQKDGYS